MLKLEEIENSILNADCLDILKKLPDKCVDLVITDIPYKISVSQSAGAFGVKKKNALQKRA